MTIIIERLCISPTEAIRQEINHICNRREEEAVNIDGSSGGCELVASAVGGGRFGGGGLRAAFVTIMCTFDPNGYYC